MVKKQNKSILPVLVNKLRDQFSKAKDLTIFDYDDVWKSILKNARAKAKAKVMYGAFVSYDDSPRRGKQGKVIVGETPEKFEEYLRELLKISEEQNKEYIFLTAWNEWGEGAYLEPDEDNGFAFLEAIKRITEN